MTKAELISVLAELHDDAEVLVEPYPERRGWRPTQGELFGIEVEIVGSHGAENPAFAHIKPDATRPEGPRGF
jgi:hypothetical protein